MGPDPAVAEVRLAVRRGLARVTPGALVLVACSGGADSLALAGALAFEARRSGYLAGGITVDHGLQEGSGRRAEDVAGVLSELGLDPVEAIRATVGNDGGPEAAARDARYAALDAAADRLAAPAVVLGHTRNDQAETVLLGLARGSGARSLAGMRHVSGRYHRPLLELSRTETRRACLAMGLSPWDDPHNDDRRYARVRVRHGALPALEAAAGPGVTEALARTARLLRDDADALDAWADHARADCQVAPEQLDVAKLEELPRAVRTRVLRAAAIDAGCPPGVLSSRHVDEVERLISAWRGQEHIDLPAGVRAIRRYGKLLLGHQPQP